MSENPLSIALRLAEIRRLGLVCWMALGLTWAGEMSVAQDTILMGAPPGVQLDDTRMGLPDWVIRGNDGVNSLKVIEGGATIVQIDSSLPSNSVHFAAQGAFSTIGLGLGGSPDANASLHLFRMNEPGIRFEQTSPGNEYAWEIGGNDEGFGIIDGVTDNIVLAAAAGAPENSLLIGPVGDVGLGIETPLFPLHVFRNSDDARIAFFDQVRPNKVVSVGFRNAAPVSANNFCGFDFLLNDTVGSRLVSRFNCNLPVTNAATATSAFGIDTLNNGALGRSLSIRGNRVSIATAQSTHLLRVLNATCNGATWDNACSRKLKQDVAPLALDAARATLLALAPVTYRYKYDPEDARVGFIAEEAPQLVAMPDRETLSPMDIVAVLTRVVQEQESRLAAQEAELARLRRQVASQASLDMRLAALEARLGEKR